MREIIYILCSFIFDYMKSFANEIQIKKWQHCKSKRDKSSQDHGALDFIRITFTHFKNSFKDYV